MMRSLSIALLCVCSVVSTSGCLFFSSTVTDAGTDSGVDDGGNLNDGGVADAGRADAGLDAGSPDGGQDAGASDAGLDAGFDAGVDDGGVDGGNGDAGPDAGNGDAGPDAGNADGGPLLDGGLQFADDPFPDQPHRLRLRILAMNIDDEEIDFPLIVRIPPPFLNGSNVGPDNVRLFTTTEGLAIALPTRIEFASEDGGVLLYTRLPRVNASQTDQGVYVYFGSEAASLQSTSGPVFDAERFYAVFPFSPDFPDENIVSTSNVGITGDFEVVPSDTGFGQLGSSPLTLTNFGVEDFEDDGASIGLSVQWPLSNTESGAPFLTTGALSLRRAGGSARVRMYLDTSAEPLTRSMVVYRSMSRVYAAVEARTVDNSATVKVFGPEDDAATFDSTLQLPEVLSPVTFGAPNWPTVVDEIRIGRVQFSPTYHALTSLNMTGHLLEIQAVPPSPPPLLTLTGDVPKPPTYRWTFADCINGRCPSSGLRDTLVMDVNDGTLDVDRGAMVYASGEPTSSAPPACDNGNLGITVGVWFSPDNLRAYGPARMVTVSTGSAAQSFVLGQTMVGPDDAARFVIRDRQVSGTAVSFAHPRDLAVGSSYFVGASIEFGGDVVLCVDDDCEPANFSSTLTGDIAAVNARMRIGNESGGGRAAPGIYDEVSYWCEPLSSADLVSYYNSRQQ